ncbi:hypothetical protein FOA52_014446 [Chlamydomonas sp. UWO 241]|nr:hypothetical protein FOA52_014446 [Chlamydomonas sp. UWO 241]
MATSAAASASARSKAMVRDVPGDDNIVVSLILGGKLQSLNRPRSEPLDKALGRLRLRLVPAPPRKDKRAYKKGGGDATPAAAPEPPPPVQLTITLYSDDAATIPVDPSVSNSDAWRSGRVLQAGDELMTVVYNPPTVDKIVLPKRALVGHPLLALPVLQFAESAGTAYRWMRRAGGTEEWVDVGCSSALYTPCEADLQSTLRVECTPSRSGNTAGEPFTADTGVVEAAPPLPCGALRAPLPLPPASAPGFRIVSYNILADQYAGSTYAQQVLFNYCPPPFLDPEYRKQLVLAELARYNADVVCLQEVDDKAFHEYLLPHMSLAGYAGRYTNKMGKVKEGSATFWRTSRFVEVGRRDVLLRDVFKQPLSAPHLQWAPMLAASPQLAKALQKVTTVAQATVLAPAPGTTGEPICVVSTHLFFHPYAPHIRTMHVAAILAEALDCLAGATPPAGSDGQPATAAGAGEAAGKVPALLFVGDLNSDLNDGIPGVVELLQSGRLASDFWDWEQGAAFKWGMDEEEGSDAQQAAAPKPPGGKLATAAGATAAAAAAPGAGGKLGSGAQEAVVPAAAAGAGAAGAAHSGYDTASDEPRHKISVVGTDVSLPCGPLSSADALATPFTNYTSGYKALLDYVWFQPGRMEVVSALRQPTEDEIGSFIPSQRFPSDHLAVVYDLTPKQQ